MSKETPTAAAGASIIQLPISKKDRRRAEHKFGVAVLKLGYTMLPNLLLQAQGRLGISPLQLNVLVQLIQHWWDADSDPFLAKETIARRMGKSPRQISTLSDRAGRGWPRQTKAPFQKPPGTDLKCL
jgi:hypothetical protein